jgi:SAM-dependent methyltransferase
MKLLNFGCGATFHEDWDNIDLVSFAPAVRAHDIRKNLPYVDEYFDACYSSHTIEHMKKHEAISVIDECYRILKPQGIIRIVVPDLESQVRAYLNVLDRVTAGDKSAAADYDWMIIEVLDQLIRSTSGGEMGSYLTNPQLTAPDKDFIRNRIGATAQSYWQTESPQSKSLAQKISSKKLSWFVERARNSLLELLVTIVGGNDAKQSLREGLFRNSGEIHRWMYDRYSLQRLLEHSGFVNIQVCHANESAIPNFNKYNLDLLEGRVRKPDSLFMEAFKPQ